MQEKSESVGYHFKIKAISHNVNQNGTNYSDCIFLKSRKAPYKTSIHTVIKERQERKTQPNKQPT